MHVELLYSGQYIWATVVNGKRRFHMGCYPPEQLEALRVAANARHGDRLRKQRRRSKTTKGAK